MNLTLEDFNAMGVSPKRALKYLPYFNEYLEVFQINTPNRLIALFSNLLQESANFIYVEEIASGRAYEGNKNLGNHTKGDGVRFKGRGLGQVTGRYNYQAFTNYCVKILGLDVNFIKNPEMLLEPRYAVLSVCWFFNVNDIAKYADTGHIAKTWAIWNTGKHDRAHSKINGFEMRKKKAFIIATWLRTLLK